MERLRHAEKTKTSVSRMRSGGVMIPVSLCVVLARNPLPGFPPAGHGGGRGAAAAGVSQEEAVHPGESGPAGPRLLPWRRRRRRRGLQGLQQPVAVGVGGRQRGEQRESAVLAQRRLHGPVAHRLDAQRQEEGVQRQRKRLQRFEWKG